MNQTISRRGLVTTAALFPIGYVVGCTELQKVTSDADTIANGVAAVLPTIQALTGISAGVVAKVEAGISAVKTAAAQLGSAVAAGASTAAQQLAAGVSAVMAAVNGIAVPSWVTAVLSAAQTLAPIVMQVAGVVLAGPAPDARAVAVARATLLAAAKG